MSDQWPMQNMSEQWQDGFASAITYAERYGNAALVDLNATCQRHAEHSPDYLSGMQCAVSYRQAYAV